MTSGHRRASDGRLIGARTANGRTRLSDVDKARVALRFNGGTAAVDIAAEFGISRSRVYQIGRGYPLPGSKVADRAIQRRRSLAGHEHRWISEGGLAWCDVCGVEQP